MGNQNSIVTDHSSAVRRTKQASAYSKDPARRPQINVERGQDVLLIWLDNNINFNSADCRNTIIQLQHVTNLSTFTDGDECIRFLERMDNDKAWLIISGSLGKHIMPRVHDISQVDSIFIFCDNNKRHEQWTKEWPKIKGVFTEIIPICEALKQAIQQYEQNAIPISFIATNDDISQKALDQLEPTFMYTQILKEILLTIVFERKHFMEFINYCREVLVNNENELKNVEKFERKYGDETPIWWYTYQSFVYSMLNRSLRLMDVDMIMKMGFFISDLHRHIEQLHKQQFGGHKSNKSFMVYRGQGMSQTDFEQVTKTKGGLISFNNFLSTSKDRDISLAFAESNQSNPDLVGILFAITIDPSQSTTPFAFVNDVGYFKDQEEEVLFAMHTVFRIGDTTPMSENHRLFRVELTLTSDNDPDLCILTDRIREETSPGVEGWYRLGLVLLKMGQFEKAEQIYETLLEQTADEEEKADVYNQFGLVKDDQGEYTEAIILYEKAFEIQRKILPPNHPDLAASYNNIGLAYYNLGECPKALSFYEKALEIQQQCLTPNHPNLAASYNNIGLIYYNMNDYEKALSAHEKSLEIKEFSLPPNHPDLASSYNNSGLIYYKMGEYMKALSSCEKALAIQRQSLPPNHPDLSITYNNLGSLHGELGEYKKALPYLEKAREIQQQTLPSNHPSCIASYDNTGLVHETMGNYSEARSFYERAVNHAQCSLPLDHPNLQRWKNNLDRVNKNYD